MKRLLLLITVLTFSVANAQTSFSHAVGGKLYFTSESSSDYSAVGVLYSPRLNVMEVGDNGTLSIGTHLGLAFGGNSRTGTSFVYDIPAVVEYNFGSASSTDNDDAFGFYLGGGYGIHNSSDFDESINGPVIGGGLRFFVAEKAVDINFSYLISNKTYDLGALGSVTVNQSIIGVGLQYGLGF